MNEEVQSILAKAAERAHGRDTPYAGLVTPAEAWRLRELGAARIIDVRTEAEWLYVGRVPDSQLVEWRAFKADKPNPEFIHQLRDIAVPHETLLFLCRSAQRSHAAATLATASGFPHCYNILEGFEGDLDTNTQRGHSGGWRKAGLPWIQS